MARLFEGKRTFLHLILRPIGSPLVQGYWRQRGHRATLDSVRGRSDRIQRIQLSLCLSFQRLQGALPLNPQGFNGTNVSPDLAFNTAISFLTNTNWQSYSGESTLSYLVQMAALTVQNFASAAAGIAVAIALVRGFARQQVNSHRQLLGRSRSRDALHPIACFI